MLENLMNNATFLYSAWIIGFLAVMIVLCFYLLLGRHMFIRTFSSNIRTIASRAVILNFGINIYGLLYTTLGIPGRCIATVCLVPCFICYVALWPLMLILEAMATEGDEFNNIASHRGRWS